MEPNTIKSNDQDILITTIHNQESVVEVYLNEKRNVVTELVHKTNNRASIYQYALEAYLKERKNFNGVEDKIINLLELQGKSNLSN